MYAKERHQAIAQLLSSRGRCSVAELAELYGVTSETVRRDLSRLEQHGLIRRVHGGAVPAERLHALETRLADRDQRHTEQKHRIATRALSYLPSGESTVIVDAGSTTARLVELLSPETQVTVITHSVPIAAAVAGSAQVDLHLLPGRVRPTTQAAVGAETVAALSRLRADVAFVGLNGVTADHGLSTPDSDEAAVKRAIVAAGQRVIALGDSTKLGEESTVSFADLDRIDLLVTDSGASRAQLEPLTRTGLEVVLG